MTGFPIEHYSERLRSIDNLYQRRGFVSSETQDWIAETFGIPRLLHDKGEQQLTELIRRWTNAATIRLVTDRLTK